MRTLPELERTLKLFIVSTPIGNLKDISARALETLQSVDYILCEDTRRAHKLKTHFGLNPKLVSFHEHNEKQRVFQIVSRMKNGKTFALISDAGMPLVSDPGYLLIREMIREDLPFTCIPGASAVTTAIVLSGFTTSPFTFLGFLPLTSADRTKILAGAPAHTIVLFESPERIFGLLREIGDVMGDRDVALCREITKLHEEVMRGKVSELLQRLASRRFRGEFTVVIAPGEEFTALAPMTDEALLNRYSQLTGEGLSGKEALKKLTKESGHARNELYALIHPKK